MNMTDQRLSLLYDIRTVMNDGKSTKADLLWALRRAVAFAEQAERKLRVADPFIDAIIEIAEDVVRERTGA